VLYDLVIYFAYVDSLWYLLQPAQRPYRC